MRLNLEGQDKELKFKINERRLAKHLNRQRHLPSKPLATRV